MTPQYSSASENLAPDVGMRAGIAGLHVNKGAGVDATKAACRGRRFRNINDALTTAAVTRHGPRSHRGAGALRGRRPLVGAAFARDRRRCCRRHPPAAVLPLWRAAHRREPVHERPPRHRCSAQLLLGKGKKGALGSTTRHAQPRRLHDMPPHSCALGLRAPFTSNMTNERLLRWRQPARRFASHTGCARTWHRTQAASEPAESGAKG